MSPEVLESTTRDAEIVVGIAGVLGAMWLGLTGCMVGARLRRVSDRLPRAGAMACVGLLALSQGAPAMIDHTVWVTTSGLVWAAGALALGAYAFLRRPESPEP